MQNCWDSILVVSGTRGRLAAIRIVAQSNLTRQTEISESVHGEGPDPESTIVPRKGSEGNYPRRSFLKIFSRRGFSATMFLNVIWMGQKTSCIGFGGMVYDGVVRSAHVCGFPVR
jgi:hypothetical protein